MSTLDTLSGQAPRFGSQGKPMATGAMGETDNVRLKEAALPGQAVAHRDTTDPTLYQDAFLMGNASARPEFWGVLNTKGSAPLMALAPTTDNAGVVSVIYCGYAPVLIAPGYAVRAGQYLEPVLSGDYRGYFRPCPDNVRGPAQSVEYVSSVASDSGVTNVCGAIILGNAPRDGLIYAATANSSAVTAATETAFDVSYSLPAYSLAVGQVYRLKARVRFTAGNANDTAILRVRLGGLTGALLATSPTVDLTNAGGDLGYIDCQFTVRGTLGATTPIVSQALIGILPGQASGALTISGTAASAPTVDATAALSLVVTCQHSAASGNSGLLDRFDLERLA